MQFQADLLGVPVVRPRTTETTALGAAYLAGLATGVWRTSAEIAAQWQREREFVPRMSRDEAQARLARWRRAVERSKNWSQEARRRRDPRRARGTPAPQTGTGRLAPRASAVAAPRVPSPRVQFWRTSREEPADDPASHRRDPGRRHRQRGDAGGRARARRGRAQVRLRARVRPLRLELRELRPARLLDAARLEGEDRRARGRSSSARPAGRRSWPTTCRCGTRSSSFGATSSST